VLDNKIYVEAVKNNFQFLKESTSVRDAYLRSIEIPDFGYLLPLCKGLMGDDKVIQDLTEWRNTNVNAYPTQFIATKKSTENWFAKGLIENDGRILFLIVTNSGKTIGHIGFNGCINLKHNFEIDNVVRGILDSPKGIMGAAMNSLINWAQNMLPVESINLRVMSDNDHAINFCLKNGFIKKSLIPLSRSVDGDMISYNEILDGSKSPHNFLEMIYSPENISGKEMILTAGPSISAKESSYAFDAAEKGWNSQWSKYLTKFEKTFANYVGAKYALATSSCTGALQIALMSLDIGPGDEVIVPDETWVASANAIRYVGAIPIFADVELDSWNIDSQSVEKLISPKTKAIIVVHMYGAPARMTPILDLAKKYKLKVVEDAAPAIGAKWNGKSCGTFGDFGAYSFQGAKLLVTGEGGMLVTNDDDLYVKAKKIWDQGRNPNKTFWIDEDGVKFKMSNVQAAIGLAQIERADELIEMKRRIFSWYEDRLSGFKGIHLNKEVEGAKSIYWMSSIRLDEGMKLSRDDLIIELKKRNVDTRPVFPAISKYPIWPLKQDPKPIADKIGNTAMNLPSGVCLKKDDIMYVCDQIIELLELS
jgi:perosamine synthetase